MPEEDEYSDDIDFLDENKEVLSYLLAVGTRVFKEWDLNINESKTEFVHIYIAQKEEKLEDGKPFRGNEDWCSSRLLGSLLERLREQKRHHKEVHAG